jgi:hypothetical protein
LYASPIRAFEFELFPLHCTDVHSGRAWRMRLTYRIDLKPNDGRNPELSRVR